MTRPRHWPELLALLGLGHCEFELEFRDKGLVVVLHHNDPVAEALAPRGNYDAALLAGFFAGVVGHLAGRSLVGWAVSSSRVREERSVIVVGASRRIGALRSDSATTLDRELRRQLTQLAGTRRDQA